MSEEERAKELRIEQVIDAADAFEIKAAGRSRRISLAEMERAVADFFKSRGAVAAPKEED